MADINNGPKTKRKNICDNIIFEVELDDCSPEHSPKNSKTGTNSQQSGEFCFSQDSGIFSQGTNYSCESEPVDTVTEINNDVVKDGHTEIIKRLVEVKAVEDESSVIISHVCSAEKTINSDDQLIEIAEANEKDVDIADGKQVDSVEPLCVSQTTSREVTLDYEETKIVGCTHGNEKQMNVVNDVDSPNKMVEDGEVVDESNTANRIISISFKDADVAKEYKSMFVKFILSHIELSIVETDEDSLTLEITRDADLAVNEWVVMDEAFDESIKIDKTKSRKRKRSERKKDKDLFTLDTSPSISTKQNVSTRYLSKFTVVEKEERKEDEIVKPTMATCFNCDGNHSLKDCTEPKNYTKISLARNNFKSNQAKAARYHLEEDQMYGHLVPGKISENLRKALGLRRYDLPPYVYRMRVLGYPPGWIKEAEEETSDLCMFDIDGKNVGNQKRKKGFINSEKIVEYPGFNVPMEKGAHDEHKYHGVPPFSGGHDKQVMIDFINKMRSKQEDDLHVCDMDVDKIIDESVTDVSQDSQDELQESTRASPSLIDLESRKQQLLAELDTNTTSDSTKSCDVETKETSAIVKTSSFGTPIIKGASPYSKLPKPDNFSQNISPVINFENLPNATGKYEQMTGILQKVRTAIKSLQSDRST